MSKKIGFYEKNAPLLRQCYTAAAVGVNMLSCGFYLGYSAVAITSLRSQGPDFQATKEQESWIAGIPGFSQILGNLMVYPLMENFGRKKTNIIISIPLLLNWLITVLATDVNTIIIGRFIGGLTLGVYVTLGPMLISEMVDPKLRGVLLTIASFSMTSGVVLCQVLAAVMYWTEIALLSLTLSFTGLVLAIYSKESPSWLLSKGRVDECMIAFRYLRGTDFKQEEELQEMITKQTVISKLKINNSKSFIEKVKHLTKYCSSTMKKREFYKPLLIMLHISTMMQFTGLSVITSYTSDVIAIVVHPKANVYTWMFMMNVERLIFTFTSIFLIRALNRRTLLFFTACGCVAMYVGQGLSVLAKTHGILDPANQWIPGSLVLLYMLFIGMGFFGLCMTIRGEIFPLQYRSFGCSLSTIAGSMSLFICTKCFPSLVLKIGLPYTNFLYAGIVVYCLIFVYFMLPETKDRTLQEIEDGFRGVEKTDAMLPLKSNPDIKASQL